MWIIPRNHPLYYLYAPDTVGSKEELSELSEQLTSSLMWRSKPSQLRTWLTRWKRDKWFRRLSGRMLRLSQYTSFETRLISSLEAIPASRSLQQENAKEKTIRGISGLTSEKSSERFDPGCVSLRMLKDIFPLDSPQFSVIWKKTVTAHRGEYSVRLSAEHRTNAKESLSWPTASARDHRDCSDPRTWNCKEKRLRNDQLGRAVHFYKDGPADQEKSNTNGKSHGSSNWSTPQSRDYRSGGADRWENKERSRNLNDQVDAVNAKLNPSWVEQLMGLPVGRSQLSGETDNRIDRLRLLGNGVVPQTAEKAFRTLLKEIG